MICFLVREANLETLIRIHTTPGVQDFPTSEDLFPYSKHYTLPTAKAYKEKQVSPLSLSLSLSLFPILLS